MKVELQRGPYDGMVREIPEGERIVVLRQPAMSAAEFIAAEHRPELFEYATQQEIEHAYVRDDEGHYIYAGTRAK